MEVGMREEASERWGARTEGSKKTEGEREGRDERVG